MYLDPGSWSVVVQFLVGALVAIPALIGIYWKHVKLFFTRGRNAKSK